MSQQRVMIPEAFKVLPPLSPELPAPPRAPPPHRVAPPIARREKTAFVILNDETPPPGRSRDNSPNGRVSPFRGRGFREETSRHASREPSPSPDRARRVPPRPRSRSTSRLPVASPRTINGTSGIPKPINRRSSLSPNRTTQVLNQVNRNKSIKSPVQRKPVIIKPVIQSPRHSAKIAASPKRVGPSDARNLTGVSTKPPIPKIQAPPTQRNVEKENEKRNITSPYRRQPQQMKTDVTKSPSRIPRTRSVSRGRDGNVRASSPVRAVVRASPRIPQGAKKPPAATGEKKGAPSSEKKNNTSEKKNGTNTEKKKEEVKTTTTVDKKKEEVKSDPTPTPSTPIEEKPKLNLELDNKVPTPIEAVVSTLPGVDEKTPEMENRVIEETPIQVQPQPQVQSPPKPAEKPEEPKEVPKETKEEEIPEPSVTLVRTTTAPALELAQPDVIPTILSKGEQEISKSISEGPSEEDKDENPGGKVVASVESVRSNSSVETVRAANKDKEVEVEVLSANNLMKSDDRNRSVAWDKENGDNRNGTQTIVGQFSSALRTPDMSPLNNSVHPLDPTLPLQPPKPTGCCGRLCDRLCCRSPGKFCCCIKTPNFCSKLGRGLGNLCSKLNCCKKLSCSSCCGKTDKKPKPKPSKQRSRLRECLSRLNCFRWSRCCRKSHPPPPRDEEEGEEGGGCCAGCKYRSCGCFRALFCLNRACCQKLRSCCRCTRFGCCRSGGCCGPTPPQLDRRKSRLSVHKSQTSITQGIPKLDPTLVEHQSMMRGAVPVLPVPLAWLCCILNVFLPGTGTLLSGVFCLCFGKPRFSVNDSYPSRLTAFLINIVVAVSQLFTVIFCLVGWGWSIWWGVMMVRFAKKHKRIQMAEQAGGDQPAAAVPVAVNQNHDVERAR